MSNILAGIDAGTHSVGLAAIETDDEGLPIRVLEILTSRHDGGKDTVASGQAASMSRKASAGVARRARTHLQNRRRLHGRLTHALVADGFPRVDLENTHQYEAWDARIQLLSGFVEDHGERKRLIAIALHHMARHRGFANAWVHVSSLFDIDEPSEDFRAAADALVAEERFTHIDRSTLRFQADIAAHGLTQGERLRPRKSTKPGSGSAQNAHLLGRQMRVDVVREWREICSVQRIDRQDFEKFATLAFAQQRPFVPIERVGTDWLPGFDGQHRAPTSSLEFQEFRIRQSVASLGIRRRVGGRPERLPVEQQRTIVDRLLSITQRAQQPTWAEVAEAIGIDGATLVHTEPDAQLTARAPIDTTTAALMRLPASHPVRIWWNQSDAKAQREFVAYFFDPAQRRADPSLVAQFDSLIAELTSSELEKFESLTVESGRAAHCREALHQMSLEMQRTGDGYVVVRNNLFGVGQNVTPESRTLGAPADHPTLQRVIPPVRRFLSHVQSTHGRLDNVNVEHVREAFLGPSRLHEIMNEQRSNARARDVARQEVRAATGVENPTSHQVRRYQTVARQQGLCLYCGTGITYTSCELDHVVPRASGGSSVSANLVAVCAGCNAAKGRLPFALWAENNNRGVTLQGSLERVNSLVGLPAQQLRRLRAAMTQRLKQRLEDEPLDERSLASTAYAARDLRERIGGSYPDAKVNVYSGATISMARRASGIDKRLGLRPGLFEKSRFDRRHHAIDAAVIAMMAPSVARTLAQRDDLRQQEKYTGELTQWREFEGTTPGAIESFRHWRRAMHRLADLLRQQLDDGEIPVMFPVRVAARHARLHEEGRAPHGTKLLGEPWSPVELRRVVSDHVYRQLVDEAARVGGSLPSNPDRILSLPNGGKLGRDDRVFLFPGKPDVARIPLPLKSSAKLGGTTHHARWYRFVTGDGKTKFALLRIFYADLYDLPSGKNGDVLRERIEPYSRAVRRHRSADFIEALQANRAEHVFSVVVGDEIMVSPEVHAQKSTDWAAFLSRLPERNWRVTGFEDDTRVNLSPMLLSSEELPSDIEPLVAKVIKEGARVNAQALFTAPGTEVIRRTATGRIRRNRRSGLPASFATAPKCG